MAKNWPGIFTKFQCGGPLVDITQEVPQVSPTRTC